MWLLFAITSGFFFAALNLVERHLLKDKDSDPFAFSFFFSFTSTLFLLPVVLYQPQFSTELKPWLLVVALSLLIAVGNLLSFTSIKYVSASIVGTISKFKIVWVLLLGLWFAYEVWSPYKGLGVLLTLIAGIILIGKFGGDMNLKGVVLAFLSTFFGAVAIVIYTPLLKDFNVFTLTFLVFAVPAVINFFMMKKSVLRIRKKFKKDSWKLFLIGFIAVLANLTIISAINFAEASRVLVVVEALFILVLLGEHFLLKEKTQIMRKGLAAVIATIGAILMRISV